MSNASYWPEQEILDAWVEKNGIELTFEQKFELKKAYTDERLKYQARIAELEKENEKLNDKIEMIINFPEVKAQVMESRIATKRTEELQRQLVEAVEIIKTFHNKAIPCTCDCCKQAEKFLAKLDLLEKEE